jgi:serine/threonine-protein kinase
VGTLIGHTLGGYLVEHRLGSGGMATTYRAERASDGKSVALKVPHEQHLHDPSFRTRFLREGHLGTQLHHPNIVRVLEAGEDAGRPFIALELIDGRTLRDLISATGEMPLERALDITRQVAEALDYAHAKGVTHRDLKPENLMVERSGAVRVMDFGLARLSDAPGLTASSVFLGTPAYAAPEAISGGHTDHRQDLYALGLVLFELLQGRAPHEGSSPLEQLRSHLDGRFPRREELARSLPDSVWELIRNLVSRDPAQRPATAEAVLVRLRSLIRRAEEGTLE